MQAKEIKVNGVTYVPKQEEHKQNKPVLNLRIDEEDGIKTATVGANGGGRDIISAWAEVSCTLLNQMNVDLSAGFAALMLANRFFHNRSED